MSARKLAGRHFSQKQIYSGTGMHPDRYPRRVLLAAAGLSPQVITESVYALAVKQQPPWVPTEIHLVTTAEGAERARLSLFAPDQNWFNRLREEYELPEMRFDDGSIHVLHDSEGRLLSDIRSDSENMQAADSITALVRELTADPASALHVSIAGGRKTMGFFLGYALSLYGRPQDRLSHVLVSAPFESHQGFFYPTRQPRVIYTNPPDSRPLDTSRAEVTLAEIPFVRLRAWLPQSMLERNATFKASVEAAQRELGPPELVIDLARRRIRAAGCVIELPPAEIAFLSLFARLAHSSTPAVRCPSEGADERLARLFLADYQIALGDSGMAERTAAALRRGMDRDFFLQHRSRLEKHLRERLGPRAAPYLLATSGRRPDTTYRLNLSPEQIRFGDINEEES